MPDENAQNAQNAQVENFRAAIRQLAADRAEEQLRKQLSMPAGRRLEKPE